MSNWSIRIFEYRKIRQIVPALIVDSGGLLKSNSNNNMAPYKPTTFFIRHEATEMIPVTHIPLRRIQKPLRITTPKTSKLIPPEPVPKETEQTLRFPNIRTQKVDPQNSWPSALNNFPVLVPQLPQLARL